MRYNISKKNLTLRFAKELNTNNSKIILEIFVENKRLMKKVLELQFMYIQCI